MAYTMRFRLKVFLVAGAEADAADTLAFDVGSYAVPPVAGDVVMTSENKAVSGALAMVHRIQRGFYKNARAEVYGTPVGAPEAGNPDLSADQKLEKLYASIDTPQPSLLYAIYLANRKVSAPAAAFVPVVDNDPEVNAPDFPA